MWKRDILPVSQTYSLKMFAQRQRQNRPDFVIRFPQRRRGTELLSAPIGGRGIALITQIGDYFRRAERNLKSRSVHLNLLHHIVELICGRPGSPTEAGSPVTNCVKAKSEISTVFG